MAPEVAVPETTPVCGVAGLAGVAVDAGASAGAADGVDFEHAAITSRTTAVSMRRIALSSLIALTLAAAAASAQQIWVGRGRFWRTPPKWARLENFDGSFNFCRVYYTSDRREDGGTGWDTDFPGADNNFSVRLAELTMMRVKLDTTGQPDYVVLKLTDPLLSRCTVLHFEDAGTMHLSPDEVQSLRAYLLKGGF